jgi:hypothetical protein
MNYPTTPLANQSLNPGSSRSAIPEYWEAVTPSDTALAKYALGFMHSETSDQQIKVKYANGTITTFPNVPAYTPIYGGPIEIIYDTDTDPSSVLIAR